MSISIVSWNIDRKASFEHEISELVQDEDVRADILLLLEAEGVDDNKIEALTGLKRIKVDDGFQTKLTPRFYSSLSLEEFQLLETHYTSRLIFARLNVPGHEEIILAGVHMPSKLEYHEKTQYKDSRQIALDLKKMKEREDIGHNRFLLFGDFNMNPFEPGMIEPDGFNATLYEEEAKNGMRTDWYKKFDYFYNPMWSFMGDRDYTTGVKKLPGSYYLRTTRDVTLTFWNVFDAVIVRPEIIDIIDYESLRYVTKAGIMNLVNEDLSLKDEAYSDHLPLTFKLKV